MSKFISVETPAGPIWVEVDNSVDVSAVQLVAARNNIFSKFEETIKALKANAQYILDEMKELGPSEVEATFGIVAGVEAGVPLFGLAKASGEASYQVKLIWKKETLQAQSKS